MERNIKLLAIFNFLNDFVLYAPVAIIYFSNVAGSYALGMAVFSIVMVSSALFEIPTGIFSDRIGRKNTILCGSMSYLISDILLALAVHNYQLLLIAAVLQGLARSFFSGNNEAFLHDTLKENDKEHLFNHYLGKTSSMFQVALAISAVIGGVLASKSLLLIVWLSVIPKTGMVIISLLFTEPEIHIQKSSNIYSHLQEAFEQFLINRKLRLLTISNAIAFAFGESSYLFRSAFFISLWPTWAIGMVSAFSNIGAAISFYFSGKLIKKINELKILVIQNLYCRLVNLIALLFPTLLSPLLMSTTSWVYGVGEVAKKTLLQKEFTHEQRATMGSLNSFFGSITFGIIAFIVGLFADSFGPLKTLIIINLLQFLPLWFYRQIFKISKT